MAGGQLLRESRFHDILPSSVAGDPQFVAAAQVMDAALAEEDAKHPLVLIWARIDKMEEPLLSNLAYQLHLEGYEGWHLATTLTQKRNLVKASILLHFHRGTLYGLKKVFDILDLRGQVVEWWEVPDDPTFHPYEFDFEVEGDRPLDEAFYRDVLELIFALKNVRSHLRKLRLTMSTRGRVPAVASTLGLGVVIAVHPIKPRNVTVTARFPVVAGGSQSLHHIFVYPFGG